MTKHICSWIGCKNRVKQEGACYLHARIERLRKTEERLTVHQNLAAALMNRPWVGLTDEEIEILMDTYDVAQFDYARAIEAKLKEKNS